MTSYFPLSSHGKKLTAIALACTVLVGLSGCNNQSVLSSSTSASSSTSKQQDVDRIHANHDKGADPNLTNDDFKTDQDLEDYVEMLRKWGVKQTPDWLAICNKVNVTAMREVGFDPQKDLENRRAGAHKTNCYWSQNKGWLHFLFGQTDSVDRVKANPKFRYSETVTRDSETYYMGGIKFVGEGTSVNRYSCSLTYERDGQAYMAALIGKDPKTHDQACNELINMVSPRK